MVLSAKAGFCPQKVTFIAIKLRLERQQDCIRNDNAECNHIISRKA